MFVSFSAIAQQDSITTYFTEARKPCQKEEAFFVRKTIQTKDELWLLRTYDKAKAILVDEGLAFDKDGTKKTGQWNTYYEDGSVSDQGSYKEGKREGKWLFYHENGNLASVEFYAHDTLTKVKCWRENGEPDTVCYPDEFPPIYAEDLQTFIGRNINYPPVCRESGIQGRILISFHVDENGNATDFAPIPQPAFTCNSEFEKEALRVASMLKKWTPGVSHNRKRTIHYTLPISFRLN